MMIWWVKHCRNALKYRRNAACALQSQIQISSLFLSHKRWLVSTFFFCYTGRTLEKMRGVSGRPFRLLHI
uniref:Uncharacterized protein n=1 Tax=Salix viminalis TaxID=40686 RepID=A0A6N2NFH9_SALVM